MTDDNGDEVVFTDPMKGVFDKPWTPMQCALFEAGLVEMKPMTREQFKKEYPMRKPPRR